MSTQLWRAEKLMGLIRAAGTVDDLVEVERQFAEWQPTGVTGGPFIRQALDRRFDEIVSLESIS